MLLRARHIYPVSSPPIEDGFVSLQGGRILEIGPWNGCLDRAETEDLGEVILMPGLVNAHCHLDYTDFAGAIPSPSSFTDWIRAMVDLKADVDDAAHRRSWLRGAQQCLRHGITTLGNIETRLNVLPELWHQTPLRMVSFLEIILLKRESASAQELGRLKAWIKEHIPPRGSLGLSPHAPYTTKFELLEGCAEFSDLPMTMHVGESTEEDQMFREGVGAMFDFLMEAGRDMNDCAGQSPLTNAQRAGLLGERFVLVHGNYLDDFDRERIAEAAAHWVHCPRSHEYFGHQGFAAEAVLDRGVNLCLGTDSLATVHDSGAELDLFEEMRLFIQNHPRITAEACVNMVTQNAALALGLQRQVGSLELGKSADLIILPHSEVGGGLAEQIVAHQGEVDAVMINGEWVAGTRKAA